MEIYVTIVRNGIFGYEFTKYVTKTTNGNFSSQTTLAILEHKQYVLAKMKLKLQIHNLHWLSGDQHYHWQD